MRMVGWVQSFNSLFGIPALMNFLARYFANTFNSLFGIPYSIVAYTLNLVTFQLPFRDSCIGSSLLWWDYNTLSTPFSGF